MLVKLPFSYYGLTYRKFTRNDVDIRAQWPEYPEQYSAFNCNWAQLSPMERDKLFHERVSNEHSLVLSVDTDIEQCIAYIALHEIDWINKTSNNLALRLHPSHCGKGIGTKIMQGLVELCLSAGFGYLRHDVCAANVRAVKCYQKAGYKISGEFWRDDFSANLSTDNSLRIDTLPHLRINNGVPQIRFYWMENRLSER